MSFPSTLARDVCDSDIFLRLCDELEDVANDQYGVFSMQLNEKRIIVPISRPTARAFLFAPWGVQK